MVKHLILANSLADSRGSRFELQAPGLLEPFFDQVCKCFRVGVGKWCLVLGCLTLLEVVGSSLKQSCLAQD